MKFIIFLFIIIQLTDCKDQSEKDVTYPKEKNMSSVKFCTRYDKDFDTYKNVSKCQIGFQKYSKQIHFKINATIKARISKLVK